MLKVENLYAGYQESNVLGGVSFEVKAGQFVGLVGSNGAGKTTLLRVLSGLMPPTSGSVQMEGEELTHLPPHKVISRGLVQVPEGGRVFPHITVRDNLLLGAYNKAARAGREKKWPRSMKCFRG